MSEQTFEAKTTGEVPEEFKGFPQIKKVIDALEKQKAEIAWSRNNTPEQFAKQLSEQLGLTDAKEKEIAAMIILDSLAKKMRLDILKRALDKNDCKTVKFNEGKTTFYNEKGAITEDDILEAEAKGAMRLFKTYFPKEKDKIRVLKNKKVTVGEIVIPLGKYEEVIFYDEDGKKERWNYDTTGLKKIPVKIVSPIILQAPNKDGILSAYVQIRAKFMSPIGEKDVLGWVEHGSFKKGSQGLEKPAKPEMEDKKEKGVKKKDPEKAYGEVKDERADAELIKKYYDYASGRVNFKNEDGTLDKKAQKAITIKKLFPNAKAGDQVRVKHADATSRIVVFDAKAGDFVYEKPPEKGKHAPILDEDIILPEWGVKEKIDGPVGRKWVKRQIVEETDTYEQMATEAMKHPTIKNAFEKSTLTEAQQIETYAGLLKKFQKGNTVFFVVPAPTEIGATSKKDTLEEKLAKRTEKYRKEFGEHMAKSGSELIKKTDEYIIKKFSLRAEIEGLVHNPEAWKKYWNEEGAKGISGLDKLISALKEPIFVEAGLTEENARNKILELLQKGKKGSIDFKDILEVFGIYRIAEGKKGDFKEFQKEFEQNRAAMKQKGTDWMVFGEKFKKNAPELKILAIMAEKSKEAKAKGIKNPFDLRLFKSEPERQSAIEQYKKARGLFDETTERQIYLNHIAFSSGKLIEALRSLGTHEFIPDSEPEKWSSEAKYSIESMQDVFADSTKTKIAWEDALAGEGFDRKDLSYFGRYFDQDAPILSLRDRLHSYQNEKGELDGTERILASKTVEEYNRLMEKGLERLAVFKGKQAIALYQKYANKPGVEDSTILFKSAFDRLKINKLEDLKMQESASGAEKEIVNFRKDLIKMGFYFDEQDREMGILLENKESGEKIAYSKNPLVYLIQKKAVEAGYPSDIKHLKNVETKTLLWIAAKLDVTKGDFSAGVGTGIDILDLGDGVKLLLGFVVDPASKSAALMVGLRFERKIGKGSSVGVSVGPTLTLPGLTPGAVTGVDFTFPLTDVLDAGLFVGGGITAKGLFHTVSIGIRGNLDRAIQKHADELLSSDEKMRASFEVIDKTADHDDARYFAIIANPVLNRYLKPILDNPHLEPEAKQMVILRTYSAMRTELHNIAAEKTETPGFDVPILDPILNLIGGKVRVTGVGVVEFTANGVSFAGTGIRVEVGRTEFIYPVASQLSKEAAKLSDKEIQEAFRIKFQQAHPDKIVVVEAIKLGSSGDFMLDENGNQCVREKKETVDLTAFKESPALEQYNEKLKPLNMKFELDSQTGLFELKIYGAIGNLKLMIDPGMEHKGLILRGDKDANGNTVQKVYLAAGEKPELFISREKFRTLFAKKGSPLNTIITISDTPDRTRAEIEEELAENGAWLYKKAGQQWELLFTEGTETSNVIKFEEYQKVKKYFETSKKDEGQSFKSELFEEYKKELKKLPFIKEDSGETIDGKLVEGFAKGFLNRNQILYRKLTRITEKDTVEEVGERTKKLVAMLQNDAGQKPPKGIGRKLNYLEVNAVLSNLMDLSFIELEKSGASVEEKRAKFEKNLRYAKKAALIPHFRKKIAELAARGKGIDPKNTPEKLADYVEAALLKNVSDEDLKKAPDERGEKFPENYIFVATAASMGIEGMPMLPYYIQRNYSVLGLREEALTKGEGIEHDLAVLILEMASPLETETDKKFIQSPLAQKVIEEPGLWFVLGDELAKEAKDCAKKALQGTELKGFKGWDEFKKIVKGIRDTQLHGGNIYTYKNQYGNTYEFHIDTKVASGAHANCGNPAFGAKESLEISTKPEKGKVFLITANTEKTATARPITKVETKTVGVAGVVAATSEAKAAPPSEKLGRSAVPHPPEKTPPEGKPPSAGSTPEVSQAKDAPPVKAESGDKNE